MGQVTLINKNNKDSLQPDGKTNKTRDEEFEQQRIKELKERNDATEKIVAE